MLRWWGEGGCVAKLLTPEQCRYLPKAAGRAGPGRPLGRPLSSHAFPILVVIPILACRQPQLMRLFMPTRHCLCQPYSFAPKEIHFGGAFNPNRSTLGKCALLTIQDDYYELVSSPPLYFSAHMQEAMLILQLYNGKC